MVKLYRVNSRERMTRQRWDEVPAVKWFQNVFTWKSKFFPDNFYDETRNRHHHKLRMNSNEIQHDERKKLSAWLYFQAHLDHECVYFAFFQWKLFSFRLCKYQFGFYVLVSLLAFDWKFRFWWARFFFVHLQLFI